MEEETDDDKDKLIIKVCNEKTNNDLKMEINQDNCNNYFKKAFLSRLKLNIFIIILSIIAFILEFFYRKPLFNYSLDFEKKWQDKASKETISMFKVFATIGGKYLIVIPVLIILCFFTLIKSYVYILGFLFCVQFHSMMKIWYGNVRPFWEKESLYAGECVTGFGNPSGHSITNVFLYMNFFIYFKETKKLNKKYFILTIILIYCLFWILMVLLSRLFLGVHSLNQVIYGSTLAVIFSLFIFVVFKIHRMPISVYKKFFRVKKYIYIILGIFSFFILISIFNVFIFNQEFDNDKYGEILERLCKKKIPESRRFNFESLVGSLIIFAMFGMYLGQIVFWYLIENKYKINEINLIKQIDFNINEEKLSNNNDKIEINDNNNNQNENNNSSNDSIDDLINHWNMNRVLLCSNVKTVLKIILTIILCLTPGILYIIISYNANNFFIFIFKFGLPLFTIPFLLYSYGFYFIIELSCGPKDILIKRLEQNI